MFTLSLQEKYSPKGICFGCGPANSDGLQIKSFVEGDEIVARFQPQKHHQAFPGVLNGGIVGSLLDCHCNWTASYYLMKESQLNQPPCTVTAEYTIKLKRPTPVENPVELKARLKSIEGDRATISGELWADGKLCATCEGIFVAVKPGHPAYHRW
ncbi:MAG: PaaI family thioesterase [Gammaproteobacteria bacterium]